MEVLLLAGSGFIGRHVAGALLAAGHRVCVTSRGDAKQVPAGVEVVVADRARGDSLARALADRRFDLTVDFRCYQPGDLEPLRALEPARLGRLLMISTGQVYLVTQDSTPPFDEAQSEGPLTTEPQRGTRDHAEWSYGVGKRAAEETLFAWGASHGVPVVALRLPIVQGESDVSLRLWGYLERILDGGPVLLPDGGGQSLRQVYAGDVGMAIAAIAARAPGPRAIYNLAQPDTITLRELLRCVADTAGRAPTLVECSWAEMTAAGLDATCSPYAGKWCSIVDPSHAIAELGVRPERALDYLPRVVRWHIEHRPARSHAGYAQRGIELELAKRARGASSAAS